MDPEGSLRIMPDTLKAFCAQVFEKQDISSEDAEIAADSLVEADVRGIDSHGVARLGAYLGELRAGYIQPRAEARIVSETPVIALIDGGGGLGQPISKRAMEMAIRKASGVGAGFVTVRNSNHYGTAGYYAMMALAQDMIGISMTNAAPLAVPTYGRDAKLGTNPISVAAPAGKERPFVLDMATSTVSLGKLEVYDRKEESLPLGWAVDETGQNTPDASRVICNVDRRDGPLRGGLLPLGGIGELLGGHKGYGLAMMVDILSGVLPGAGYADKMYLADEEGRGLPANVGHFFGALRIDAFRPIEEFKATMDDLIHRVKTSPKAAGQMRIYVHGEKEFEAASETRRNGILLHPAVVASLKAISGELGIPFEGESARHTG